MEPVLPNDLVSTTVRSVREVGKDVRTYEFVQPEDWDLPCFTPGAHIDVHIPGGFVRSYSLMGDPGIRNSYKVAVSCKADGLGGSAAMHDRVRVGDWISVSLPKNYFPLAKDAKKHVFIAGGIGVTPFLSMIPVVERSGARFELHMCSRSEEDTPFLDELRRIGSEKVKFYHSQRPSNARLNVVSLLSRLDDDEHVYCCGPERLMEAVRTAALSCRSLDRVHFERFDKPNSGVDHDRPPYMVNLARQGRKINVNSGETMLAALDRQKAGVDFGCEGGSCGKCRIRYLDGQIDHRDFVLSDVERKSFLMPCVSSAISETVTVDL
jgi:ferredoxin-NADP reductase